MSSPMGYNYNPHRSRNLYDPASDKPFKVSRSKIDRFVECPRCFYIDRRLGTDRPPGFPFNINSAVDKLLKTEFDTHRAAGTPHPLQESYGIDAIPAAHAEIDAWRENFKGVQFHHEPTNLVITGAIDDLWIDSAGRYLVVDYKATAKSEPVTSMEAAWMDGYKRQMEIYQWLLRRNGLEVADTGYFVYCTGRPDAPAFDARIDFDVHLIPYEGQDDWVEPTIFALHECLNRDEIPPAAKGCDYCAYVGAVNAVVSENEPE
ncbi:MAG: PD-(D/E)XK nuclease family protein [Xanthomonadales bacterium]